MMTTYYNYFGDNRNNRRRIGRMKEDIDNIKWIKLAAKVWVYLYLPGLTQTMRSNISFVFINFDSGSRSLHISKA